MHKHHALAFLFASKSQTYISPCLEDHQTFLIEINRKQIILPKVIRMSWPRAENFGNLEQHLKTKKLKTFLELSGMVYPDLVKVLYANLKFNNGMEMEIKC